MTHLLPDLGAVAWTLIAIAGLIVGISKTALPGANTISIAIFASVMPAKQSTGALLLLLIVGDMFAVWTYRRDADWRTLLRLTPAVVVGLVAGAAFLAFADDSWVQKLIGAILLALIAVTLLQRRKNPASGETSRLARAGYGSLGGFTTMVANAGGPVMSMYFLAARFSVKQFLGTAAWFFAAVNLCKLPFSIGLGLITVPELLMDLLLVPAVVIGAFFGRWIANRISQKLFDNIVVVLTIVGSIYLIVK